MEGNAIPVSESTNIIVKVSGDLFLHGEEQSEVRFISSEDRIRVNQTNENLYVETHASLDLSVPRGANVIIEKIGGSALVEDLDGSFLAQKVGGDLALRRLANVSIQKVGGTCLVEQVSGMLSAHKIGGDLTLRQVDGPVEVEIVGGQADLQLTEVGALNVRAGGDLTVYFTGSMGARSSLRAGGSMELFLPPNLDARFNLTSIGELIRLDFNRQEAVMRQEIEAREYEVSFGEGSAVIEARAGGDIMLTDREEEPEPISDQLDDREEAWKEASERRGFPSWSAGFGFDRSSAWADMISRRAQEAARRAEQRAQAAVRRTEAQIRAAAERELRRGAWSGWSGPAPAPSPAPPPAEPVTEKERLMVLQMLQDQKITIEQAEKLLAALEGKFNR